MRIAEISIGLILALVTCIFIWLLPNEWARGAVSNLLTLISSIYVGFALVSGSKSEILKQVIGCAFFVALSLLGLWLNWWFLVVGLFLHGFWDFLHHKPNGGKVAPQWYIPFCAFYDWGVAIFVGYYYALAT